MARVIKRYGVGVINRCDDLMRQAGYINTNTHEPFTWYGIAALIYLVITLISQAGIRKLELRFTRFERGVE